MKLQLIDSLWSGLKDGDGEPLAGGLVYTYFSGTSTPLPTFTDKDGLVSSTNPIELDAIGRASVWGKGAYKFVIRDSDNAHVYTVDGARYGIVEEEGIWCGVSDGADDAYILTPAEAILEYTTGNSYTFIPNFDNAGPSTINISGLGVKDIVLAEGSPLSGGEIVSGNIVSILYDGGDFLLNTSTSFSAIEVSGLATCGQVNASTASLAVGNITTANVTTGNITTLANCTTAGITTANITTANITTLNVPTMNITTIANCVTAGISTGNITTANITTGNITTLANCTTAGIGTANISTGNVTTANVTTGNITTLANCSTAGIGTANITTIANCSTAGIGTANITTANVTTGNITTLANCITARIGTVYTSSITSGADTDLWIGPASGRSFLLGTGAGNYWHYTDKTVVPSATGFAFGSSGHPVSSAHIINIMMGGKIFNGRSYLTGTYSELRSITHPTAGYLSGADTVSRTTVEGHIQKLYRLIATLMNDNFSS